MVLHREDGILTVLHSFDRTVIEVEMGHFKWLRARDAPGVAAHREPVVLRRDKYLPGCKIPHRMVTASMAVRQLHRVAAQRETEQLVAEADAEDRQRAVGELAQRVDGIADNVFNLNLEITSFNYHKFIRLR